MNGFQTSTWKWIAGLLCAVMTSNLATALAFRVSDDHIASVATRRFTEISSTRGMYVLEGRPRLALLERDRQALLDEMRDIRERLARIEAALGK